jgi:hypothetical protein
LESDSETASKRGLLPDYRDTVEALVHKDIRLSFDGNRYCVPPRYVGSKLTIKAPFSASSNVRTDEESLPKGLSQPLTEGAAKAGSAAYNTKTDVSLEAFQKSGIRRLVAGARRVACFKPDEPSGQSTIEPNGSCELP